MVATKCKGTDNRPPPPFTNEQAVFSFFGSFVLLTLPAGIGHSLVTSYGSNYLLLMPPFGAFICLQFGLTQAPAAQPRSCLLGQLLSVSIALIISVIPLLPVWFKQVLGTSLAIGAMTRCGITHPPAGASAFLFSSGTYGMTHFVLLLAGNVLAIIVGSIINNTSEKRQYPTYIAMGCNPKDAYEYLKRD
ncbi:HPP family [Seminavis robusta]|uniref:HPP family n=1 Tax=Seminavis robusta TaxID=568900 RepID=A0A9N8HWS5_9STRA|nr:HPP family [Seminavis robusta]|eukprot:Sro2030_g311820.1 HPP family (190) ;mRNA; r:17786-18473